MREINRSRLPPRGKGQVQGLVDKFGALLTVLCRTARVVGLALTKATRAASSLKQFLSTPAPSLRSRHRGCEPPASGSSVTIKNYGEMAQALYDTWRTPVNETHAAVALS